MVAWNHPCSYLEKNSLFCSQIPLDRPQLFADKSQMIVMQRATMQMVVKQGVTVSNLLWHQPDYTLSDFVGHQSRHVYAYPTHPGHVRPLAEPARN
jgi:hypothetical protein